MKTKLLIILLFFLIYIPYIEASPPSLTIISPQDGTFVNQTVLVEAQLTTLPKVRSVKFYIDNELVGEDTTSPYQYSWDTTTYSDGQHEIYASRLQAPERPGPFKEKAHPILDSPKINVTVDNTPPLVSIIVPTDSSMVTGSITSEATAQDNFGISKVEFKIDSVLVTEFTQPPYIYQLDTTTIQDGLHIFEVIAYDLANNQASASVNFTVDNSPPTTPLVIDDGDNTFSLNELHATWSSSDPESGIIEYKYAIGTTQGGTDVVGWTSAGTSTELTETNLTLTADQTYYFSVEAINGVGLSNIGYSDGITVIVDTTTPFNPIVIDDGQYTTSNTQLHAYWISADPETGIIENQYSIGTEPGATDLVDWTSVGVDTEVTHTDLLLNHGQTYYFNIKSKNAAGLWSEVGLSDGIIINTHIPIINTVTPADNSIFFIGSPVIINVDAQDNDSDPLEYRFLVDDRIEQDWSTSSTYTWTASPTLTFIRNIYCQVRDDKGAQASQDVYYNIEIDTNDTTPPTTPIITVDDYSNSLSSFHASWSCEDPESGIIEFQYAIGTTPGATEILSSSTFVVGWTSVGTDREVTHYGLNLIKGWIYYFRVRAMNGVGMISNESYSTPITASVGNAIKITSPYNNALITESEFTIKGIAQGINEVYINEKPVTVNLDGTFEGPILIVPGEAYRQGIDENNPDYIIMSYPGPTTITATADEQTQAIIVYCYQLFIKRRMYADNSPAHDYIGFGTLGRYLAYEMWNSDLLESPPFENWQDAEANYRRGRDGDGWWHWQYYFESYPTHRADYSVHRGVFHYIYDAIFFGTTDYTIHTPPKLENEIKPIALVFKNCIFLETASWINCNLPLNISSYQIQGIPLKKLYGELNYPGYGPPNNACYIILEDYPPDTELKLQVDTPFYPQGFSYSQSSAVKFQKAFSFEGVELLSLETVREVPYNSGNYIPVETLPIFQPDDGIGRGAPAEEATMPYLKLKFNQELSNNQTNTAQATLTIATESTTYNLTETAFDSGLFTEPTNNFTIQLEPVIETLPMMPDELTCLVTSLQDGLNNEIFNLNESATNSLNFNDVKVVVSIAVNQEPAPHQIDILTLNYTRGLLAGEETLTETDIDSKVFTNQDNSLTVKLNNYNGFFPETLDINIPNNNYLELSNPRVTLKRIYFNPYIYTNEPMQDTDLPPNNPLDNGQGIYRIRIKGLTEDAQEYLSELDIVLTTEVESITVPVSMQPDGSYMTDKLVLLPEGDTTTYDGVITLCSRSGEDELEVELKDDIKPRKDTSKAAFVASWLPDFNINIFNVADILDNDLGYTVSTPDESLTKQESLKAVPKHSLWCSFTHGVVAGEDRIFKAFSVGRSKGSSEKVFVYPDDIASCIGDNEYKLVFLNGCRTADDRQGSNAKAFKQAFKAEVYMGWKRSLEPDIQVDFAEDFFKASIGGVSIRKAIEKAKKTDGGKVDPLREDVDYIGEAHLETVDDLYNPILRE